MKGVFSLKVEKINDNKVKIVLTLKELTKREISLEDIKKGNENVQNFFFEILENVNITEDFPTDSSQLFVEVSTTGNDIFMITITKTDCLPDTNKYFKNSNNYHPLYTVSSNIYSFSSLDTLYLFCKKAVQEDLFVGTNSLYELNNKYYLLFSKNTIKNCNFVKTFSIISEYSDKYFSKQENIFLEYAKLIISKNAIYELEKI